MRLNDLDELLDGADKPIRALSDRELARLNEAVSDEGVRRGWGTFWQDCGPPVDVDD